MAKMQKNQDLTDLLLAQQKHAKAAEDPEVMECSTDECASAAEDPEIECPTDEISEGAYESLPSFLERTSSQAAAQAQIQQVVQRLNESSGAVQELERSVAAFSSNGDARALQESEKLLGAAQKQARNLGEDLLEDLLSLDTLSGLIIEDRSKRKAAILDIERLLANVDKSKSRLASLQKDLQTALDAESKRHQEVKTQGGANEDFQHEAEPSPKPHSSKVSPDVSQALPSHRVPQEEQRLMAPDRAMWKEVARPVEFQTRQERGGYALLAAVPGLNTQDLVVKLSDDHSTLTVAGMCEPTAREAEQMRQQLAAKLQRLARTSPQRFKQLCSNLDIVAEQTYAQLGEGMFGTFSETFQLPTDVDTQRVKASFDDGVLRLTLPRRVRREARPLTARHPSARFFGQPGFGW